MDLHALLVGLQIGAATVENSMEFLKKWKIELPYDPPISLLKEIQNTNQKIYAPLCLLQWGFFYNNQDMEATQVSINRQVDKNVVVHIYNEILCGHKKEWNLTISNSIDGPKGYYA